MKTSLIASLIIATSMLAAGTTVEASGGGNIPGEPVQIGHEPQFLFDSWIVDNHWAIKYKRQSVQRVFHQPKKHPGNPIITSDLPSYVWVMREPDAGLFRMYYQANTPVRGSKAQDDNQETLPDAKGRAFRTDLCYAESEDGIHWTLPHLDLFPGRRDAPNNIVIGFHDNPAVEACAPVLLEVPEKDRRGFRYLLMYRAKGSGSAGYRGIRIAGSMDGIHFNEVDDQIVAHLHSDHHNSISYDPARDEYVMYCRAKDVYRAWGTEMIDTGASRRIARMASKELWTDWMVHAQPQTIMVPDEIDDLEHFGFFYGMPTRHYAGIYWGFLEPFRMNDFIYTELATSRDGFQFQRFSGRPKLIEYGEDGTWDDTMIFGSPAWVEVGDEWWFYYTGWDGPHGTSERNGAVGLATVRKEGLVSMRGPSGGGVVATRRLIWPGGDLVINADASRGELTVRVSDAKRKPVDGFDHAESGSFTGNHVAHAVRWNEKSLDALKGEELRLEFYLRDADLFTFSAAAE